MSRRAGVVLAHRSASKRLQRRPVALRATFNAHGPMQIVRRTVPRESTAKSLCPWGMSFGGMPTPDARAAGS
jgi:hypothetical protein